MFLFCFAGGLIFNSNPSFSKDLRCDEMVQVLPEQLRDLPVVACEHPEASQIIGSVDFTVPADRVRMVEELLISEYGMKPLRFVCCGYETHPVSFELPQGSLLLEGKPEGAYRALSMSLTAPGLQGENDVATQREFLEIGEADAFFRIELIDY